MREANILWGWVIPLVFFWGMCSWGNENMSVFFFFFLASLHNTLFGCIDTGACLCGSSLCQAMCAAWSSVPQRQQTVTEVVSCHASCCLYSVMYDQGGWIYPKDGQRLKWEWGWEKEEWPCAVTAKWWQTSEVWFSVEERWKHHVLHSLARP